MAKSKIEWTESTWNPTTGCDKVSQGCKICFAELLARRLKAMGNPRYKNGFKLTLHDDKIDEPRKWKKGRVIFVNSMSDLFHQDVPLEFIKRVFKTMNETPQHTYQILTKRGKRLAELSNELNWTPNIWMGVSVEDKNVLGRIDYLRRTDAKIKFLSLEPLLGPLKGLNLDGIDWVIVGGESGPKARPMESKWVHEIHKKCIAANVPFFFKQWGVWGSDGVKRSKKANGRLLNDRTYDEMPQYKLNLNE